MNEFETWLNGCKLVGGELTVVEESDLPQTGIYSTQKKYKYGSTEYGTEPVYNVWYKGERMYCGTNYKDAVKFYREAIEAVKDGG